MQSPCNPLNEDYTKICYTNVKEDIQSIQCRMGLRGLAGIYQDSSASIYRLDDRDLILSRVRDFSMGYLAHPHPAAGIRPCFKMGQDKMNPRVVLWASFKVEIPLCKHWLSAWPMALYSGGLIQYTDGSRMAGVSGASVCGVRPRR
jgi:hypothetical protein